MSDGWRDIESAPKDGTWILVVQAGRHPYSDLPFVPITAQWDGTGWWTGEFEPEDTDDSEHFYYNNVTHWMPLPPLPAPPLTTKDKDDE